MDAQDILNLPMQENDADAETVRDYLKELLLVLWKEKEGFSGKRPFGNSGWENELYQVLVYNNIIEGSFDEDGWLDDCDDKAADQIIVDIINAL